MFGETTLGDFCETGSGSTPSRAKLGEYYGGSIPWVKSGELREGVVTLTEESVTEAGAQAARLKLVPKGSLLVAMYGATVGRTALLGVNATTNQAVCHLRPDTSRADTRYVWFALQAKLPELLARRVGGAQPNISQETIRTTKIWLPSLPEQRRIADIFDKADAIRRKRKEAIALTEELLRSAFLDMFGDPVTNPNGWRTRTLDELGTDFSYGTSTKCDSDETGRPVLRIPNVVGGKVDIEELKYAHMDSDEAQRFTLSHGDLLFVRSNGNPNFIARSAVFNRAEPMLFASYLIRARFPLNSPVSSSFVHALFSADSFRRRLLKEATTTAGNYNINTTGLGRQPIPLPPAALQSRYSRVEESVWQLCEKHRQSSCDAEVLFDALAHRAFRGELTGTTGATTPQLALFDAGAR